MKSFSLGRLTAVFGRVGNLTFGGGDPTMAALYSELVTTRQWLAPETYGLVYALARITPGTNLLAFCAGAAWELGGWAGALLAVLAAAVPAAVCVVLLTLGYQAWQHNAVAMAAIAGTLAAAVGLMATSAWQLLAPSLVTRDWRRTARALAMAGAAVWLPLGFGMSPVAVLGLAAVAGFLWQEPKP
jgi:chromate transporter